MGLGATIVKHLLILLNFGFIVLGLALIACGIFSADFAIIGVGVAILIISVFDAWRLSMRHLTDC